MPNKYIRKSVLTRGNWLETDLKDAINAVKNDSMSIRKAASTYKIPRKTLERRIRKNNDVKGRMGPDSLFGSANENRLVSRIKDMQKSGFPLTRDDLRHIAYQFAKQLGLKHRFNDETEKAGYVWLQSFLTRNPSIVIRKAEGLSLARSQAMNREVVSNYYTILHTILEENELFNKPSNIFNMDESGLQLNNRPNQVLAEKGSKSVSSITSTEKGETITLVACCNAEGSFLPPAVIMKGKNIKKELEDNMPPGTKLFMSQKSAYMNSEIFLRWLREHFVPRKPKGKTLLLLDGHTSHSTSVEMLEYAKANDIIIFCFPSHCTHYLQPLDRSVFKSVKNAFYQSCRFWIKNHPGRRITRYQFGELLSDSWGKAATTQNATAGFRATGIHPYNPDIIPDYAFSIADGVHNDENRDFQVSNAEEDMNIQDIEQADPRIDNVGNEDMNILDPKEDYPRVDDDSNKNRNRDEIPEALDDGNMFPVHDNKLSRTKGQQVTPITKMLSELSPIPISKTAVNGLKKRVKSVAAELTSEENLESCRASSARKQLSGIKRKKHEKKNEKKNEKENKKKENEAGASGS